LGDALRWLFETTSVDDDDPWLSQEIRDRQFRACTELIPATVVVISLLAIAQAWYFYSVSPLWLLVLSVGVTLACEFDSARHYFASKRRIHPITDRDLQRIAVRVVIIGIALYSPHIYWGATFTPDELLVLVAAVAAMIGAGGFVMAPVASAGIGWTVATSVVAAISLANLNRPVLWFVLGLLVVYCVMICMMVASASATLKARARAEVRAERQRDLVGLLLKDFEGSSRDWLWETDERGALRRSPERFSEAFGTSIATLDGESLVDKLRGTFAAAGLPADEAHDFLQLRLSGRHAFRDHVVPLIIDRETHWWSLSAKPLLDQQSRHVGWRGVGTDVTLAKRQEREMNWLANFDSLTALANRHQFQTFLDTLFSQKDLDTSAVLCIIDLDNFKNANDSLGHQVGDALLRMIAERLRSTVLPGEMLARLGGDEYALVIPGTVSAAAAEIRGNALLNRLREPFHVNESRVEVSASLGIAIAPDHASTADELFRAADTALYAAKESGRDTLEVFSPQMYRRAQHRLNTQHELVRALERGEFELHYQPQIEVKTLRVVGFEALLRWRKPNGQLVSPMEFIPIAEDSGLIVPIGDWVIDRACRDLKRWPEQTFVAVNLSAMQFASRSLIETVHAGVLMSGIDASRLEFEITESSFIHDSTRARETLQTLRAMGHRIALDDFGSGYSSLAYLRSFSIDKLKMDRAFTVGLEHDANGSAGAIVRAIIDLAGALNLRTVAEGVESASQLEALRTIGCDDVQGFLFSRPLPASAIDEFLHSWKSDNPYGGVQDVLI
jgi:diguanylate cyclase (GGDEF)-like protein